ncbi:MAG: 50S ribosomal protein L21 [Candidatus Dojkabacteria bacterium]|nr:50S ribosomal protein L21 [Candidatus Dojkabacteria bacterium]MDQ7021810.1 50S ribosomal protein L21 [Candidatus Dojkabacteria bacterium]
MDKYTIIKIGPYQYTVEEGKEYTVPRFTADEGKSLDISEVLLIAEGDKLNVGKPTVSGAKVTLNIVEQGKGEKVQQKIFKAKTGYRKTRGHRKQVTKFKVEKITSK